MDRSVARRWALGFRLLAMLVTLRVVLLRPASVWAAAAFLCLPVAGAALAWHAGGAIALGPTKAQPRPPSLGAALMLPCCLVLLIDSASPMAVNAHFQSGVAGLLALAGTGAMLAALIWRVGRHAPDLAPNMMKLLMVMMLVHAAAALMHADMMADRGKATMFPTRVLAKHISHGRRHEHYYLTLAAFGPRTTPLATSVAFDFFNNTDVGDGVCVEWHPGGLGVPWYRITPCPA